MSSDLVAFLNARLDEDTRTMQEARSWSDRDWTILTVRGRTTVHADAASVVAWMEADGEPGERIATHVARWDPARVRAEVDAKRRMIEEPWGGPDHYDIWARHLRLLALPYRDHPDYRPEWAPDGA